MEQLQELSALKQRLSEQIKNSSMGDCCLPEEFKENFTSFGEYTVEQYNTYTSVISSAKSVITIPNQWFYIAGLCCEYHLELVKYKEKLVSLGITDDMFEKCHPSSSDKSISEADRAIETCKEKARSFLSSYEGDDKEWLVSFMADYSTWGGGKNIKRGNDFTESPVLNIANTINASSGLIGSITKGLAVNITSLEAIRRSKDWGVIYSPSDPSEIKAASICTRSNVKEYARFLKKKYNLILTGAPGTGKTYLAKEIAADIIGDCSWDELSSAELKRCGFVQYHPSYDYTDFVEGLRPDSSTSFKRTDGVFKAFCKDALKALTSNDSLFDIVYDSLVKDITGKKWGQDISSSRYYDVVDDSIKLKLKSDNTVDGKHAFSKELLRKNFSHFVNNPNDFQDKSGKDGLKEINGTEIDRYAAILIKELYLRTLKSSPKYVFIIDEINRGELSKILGELFFAIDPGYRGVKGRVNTQYQNLVEKGDVFKDGFYIPDNVYILGTMNDIDRSVEAIDFAVRRRFAWREVTAEESANNMGITGLSKVKMDALNNALKEAGLNEAYYIGGAYFRKLEGSDFDSLWKYHLRGIVAEYFRGEPDAEQKLKDIENSYNEATLSTDGAISDTLPEEVLQLS